MKSEFRLVLFIVSLLTLGAGVGAWGIAMFGGPFLTTAQEHLFDTLVWIFIGGASTLLMMLGAHLRLG